MRAPSPHLLLYALEYGPQPDTPPPDSTDIGGRWTTTVGGRYDPDAPDFSGEYLDGVGGGIWIAGASTVTLDSVAVYGNTACAQQPHLLKHIESAAPLSAPALR